jgi:uncharacterized MAPEG superfamily protein
MNQSQKIVGIGAASGVTLMVLGVWGLTGLLSPPSIADAMGERVAYAVQANVVALVPLFVMLMTVGNARFFSDAIDPTRGAETPAMQIDARVAGNTFEQTFGFAIASLALSTVVPMNHLQAVWACAIVFVVARAVFWIGYRINPLYRAPGFSSTAYLNLGMIGYVLYHVL